VDVPSEHCKDVVNKLWNTVYTDNCKPISRDIFEDIPEDVCKDVLREKCVDVPREVCKYVTMAPLLTSPSIGLFASNYREDHGSSTAMFLPPILSSSMETHVTMAPLLNSSSMATFTSDYKEDHGPSTIMFLNRFPILSSSEEIHGTCTTLGLAPSCYSPDLSDPVDMWEDEEDFLDLWGSTPHNDTGEMFDKLEEEGAALRQDLEELHEGLGRLMEKHGVVGEVFDEKYELLLLQPQGDDPLGPGHLHDQDLHANLFPSGVEDHHGDHDAGPPVPRHPAGLPWEPHPTDPLAP
jgi:hypothetical protein